MKIALYFMDLNSIQLREILKGFHEKGIQRELQVRSVLSVSVVYSIEVLVSPRDLSLL